MDTVCTTLAFIDGLGAPEMLLIFVIVLVLFGGQKLPEFARGLGKSIREFKKAASGVEEEFKRALEEDERRNAAPKLPAASVTPTTAVAHDTVPDHGGPGYDEFASTTPDVTHVEPPASPPVPTPPAAPSSTPASSAVNNGVIAPAPSGPAAPTVLPAGATPSPATPSSTASTPAGAPHSAAGHPEHP